VATAVIGNVVRAEAIAVIADHRVSAFRFVMHTLGWPLQTGITEWRLYIAPSHPSWRLYIAPSHTDWRLYMAPSHPTPVN
jgi:hypothetical protein